MPTFNGWNIITMPSSPVPATVEWNASNIVGTAGSPFTGQQQIQDWRAGWLEGTVSMPSMKRGDGQGWAAFLAAAQGTANVFQFGDPVQNLPLSGVSDSISVAGSSQTGYILNVSSTANLSPGDWMQIGYRMYMAASIAGNAVTVFPPIRESPSSGATIILTNPKGLFRLKNNSRKWSLNQGKIYGVQFEIREAI